MKTQIKQCSRQACDKLTVIFLKYLRVSPSRTKNLLCQTLSTFFFLNRNPFLWPEEGGRGGGRSVMSHDVRWQMIPDGVTMSCDVRWQMIPDGVTMSHDVRMHHMMSCDVRTHHMMSECITWHHMMSGCITWCHVMSGCITWCHMTSGCITWHHMMSGCITWHHMMSGCITWCHVRSSDVILYTINMMLISLMPFSHKEKGLVMIWAFLSSCAE